MSRGGPEPTSFGTHDPLRSDCRYPVAAVCIGLVIDAYAVTTTDILKAYRMFLRNLTIWLAICSPVAVQGAETTLRCTETTTMTILGKPKPPEQQTRYYVIDDVKMSAWRMVEGERRALCLGDPSCSLKFTDTQIIMVDTTAHGTTSSRMSTTIDRPTGTLNESFEVTSGSLAISSYVSRGLCAAVSTSNRRF